MSGELHYRSFTSGLEVRAMGDGRTIYGIAVPYNAPTRINDTLVEQFCRGAFNHQVNAPRRVRFAREHVALGGSLIGAATMMRDDAAGLYVELRASNTPVGNETLELVKDGALSQLSIAFRERQNRRLPGNVIERRTADLNEVAAVMEGAYGDLAAAVGVRSADGGRRFVDSDAERDDAELRMNAEKYLAGLPELPDPDLRIRAINLGLVY